MSLTIRSSKDASPHPVVHTGENRGVQQDLNEIPVLAASRIQSLKETELA